jgi:hypothetical protein
MEEMAATQNSLFANDNPANVCGMLASAEATRQNVATFTRRQADCPQKDTQQSRRSLDDEGFRCNPAFSEDRCHG